MLRNERTGQTVYAPPSEEHEIREPLNNLEKYINQDDDDIDPLIKLAAIHHQFETIHPLYEQLYHQEQINILQTTARSPDPRELGGEVE